MLGKVSCRNPRGTSRLTSGPSWSGQYTTTSPALARDVRAWAISPAWVRATVTLAALAISPKPVVPAKAIDASRLWEMLLHPRAASSRYGMMTTERYRGATSLLVTTAATTPIDAVPNVIQA